MEKIDVICIGAINFDYMFFCKRTDIKKDKKEEPGEEHLNRELSEVEGKIQALNYKHKDSATQIGGSSFLALKTIHAIDKKLVTAFVGVVGQYDVLDDNYNSMINLENTFHFINNKEWLFYTDDNVQGDSRYIGKSCVRLCHSKRDNIYISSCANNLLLKYIKEKETKEGNSFVEFLTRAKWIHISSLGDFEQFSQIMNYVQEARKRNPFLQVSLDPGSEYTGMPKEKIQPYLKMADYVFLSETEKDKLIGDKDLKEHEQNKRLFTYFDGQDEDVNTKLFIIKNTNCHKLINFANGTPYVFYHKKLPAYRILNDTGAGDCFAGGVIAGMLSSELIAHQPAPIELGVLAAKARMETSDGDEIFDGISNESKKFMLKRYRNGTYSKLKNFTQFIRESHKTVFGYIGGIITSIIANFLYSMFF